MTELIIFIIATVLTVLILLGIFIFGYYIGLKNVVEISKKEVKTNEDPIFSSDKPYSWDLEPEDIDSIENWEEFEERIEE